MPRLAKLTRTVLPVLLAAGLAAPAAAQTIDLDLAGGTFNYMGWTHIDSWVPDLEGLN
ncbi:MAG: hypothetical protein HRU13_14105, partial [Phycisphaerales bacterium]|nr:hypothetical protein [Phycisphaerales bacterium]